MGRARLRSRDFPGGAEDGAATLEVDGRAWRFQHVSIGNPQCSIRVGGPTSSPALDLATLGPAIEHAPRFPNRTNVSFWCELGAGRDPRAHLRARGGGDALVGHRRLRRGDRARARRRRVAGDGAARRRRARGRGRREASQVVLTGWAVPVYRGELSDELVAELAGLADAVACRR